MIGPVHAAMVWMCGMPGREPLPADPADDSDIDAQLATIDTAVAAIQAKTDNLPSDPADDSDIDSQLATIDSNVDAIKAVTDALNDPTAAAIADQGKLWPDGIVPYVIDNSVDEVENAIRRAIDEYHNKTNLRFVPRNGHADFVRFIQVPMLFESCRGCGDGCTNCGQSCVNTKSVIWTTSGRTVDKKVYVSS